MSWISRFFSSSIGRKLIMSLTGLFLILFLIVHLLGNFQLLVDDGGVAFNNYTYKMTHSPLIKLISYGLYFFIVLHTIMGVYIWIKNRQAKGQRYAVRTSANASFSSKNMALLGILIFAFILIHMGDFWLKMKMGELGMVESAKLGIEVKDMFARVDLAFDILWIVVVYVIGQIVLGFHLWHGFQSAFQTLGINHRKYTPIIKGLGQVYSVIVPLGFAIIPILHYFDVFLF